MWKNTVGIRENTGYRHFPLFWWYFDHRISLNIFSLHRQRNQVVSTYFSALVEHVGQWKSQSRHQLQGIKLGTLCLQMIEWMVVMQFSIVFQIYPRGQCIYPCFVTTRFVIKTRFVIIYYKMGWENIITIWVDSYNPFCNKNPNYNKTLSLQWKEKIYLSQ